MVQEKGLQVIIAKTREHLGKQAADAVFERITQLLQTKESINMIFAAAPSQNEFLESLIEKPVDWQRINAFHMDEYVGLSTDAPQRFGNFLRERLFDKVPFKAVNFLNGSTENQDEECRRYSELLKIYPADIVCMGIGENAHIAFNDPHTARFDDPVLVKIVDLDEQCRIQQVNDNCFNEINEVPTHALTLTVPALMSADYIFCMVPGEKKANAVYHTLKSKVTEKYPSTILLKHSSAILFIDKQSSYLL